MKPAVNSSLRFVVTLGLASIVGCSSDNSSPAASGGANTTSGGASTTSGGANATGGAGTSGAATTGGVATNAGAGGAAAGAATRPPELPASESQADLLAFIMAGSYKLAPWIAETAEPRAGIPGSQHGSNVRVWGNPTLAQSLAAGRDGRMAHEYPDQWSMAVKELYDLEGELVGVAAALKTLPGGTNSAWTYFCYGPAQRCSSRITTPLEKPAYGNGADSQAGTTDCRICHGNSIITKVVPP